MTQLGNQVRALREQRGLSKRELADALGVTPPAIYHIEKGIRKPSIDLLVRLADFFDVPAEPLLRAATETEEARVEA